MGDIFNKFSIGGSSSRVISDPANYSDQKESRLAILVLLSSETLMIIVAYSFILPISGIDALGFFYDLGLL